MKPDQLDLLDICAGKHKGADTSVEAFQTTQPKARENQRARIMTFIRLFYPGGLTCEEASRLLEIPYSACSARFSELKAIGAIRDSGKRRKTSHGKSARVMEAI